MTNGGDKGLLESEGFPSFADDLPSYRLKEWENFLSKNT